MTGPDPNRHLTAAELTELLSDTLVSYGNDFGARLKLVPFLQQKAGADSTTKVMVQTEGGRRVAVVSCARPASPDLVMRGVERAESVRNLLGNELGAVIIKPLASGYIDGRSYAIFPWCTDLSSNRYMRFIQRSILKRPLLKWLRAAVAATATAHDQPKENTITFAAKLREMESVTGIADTARSAIRTAFQRLESGAWKPHHVFDHNDLWGGNVLLPGQHTVPPVRRYPFVLIDWVGAETHGYGITDLIRLARFLKLPAVELRREIEVHCAKMHCAPEDAPGHLLAASGHLHQNLEYFPEERFLEMFNTSWHYLTDALSQKGTPILR